MQKEQRIKQIAHQKELDFELNFVNRFKGDFEVKSQKRLEDLGDFDRDGRIKKQNVRIEKKPEKQSI